MGLRLQSSLLVIVGQVFWSVTAFAGGELRNKQYDHDIFAICKHSNGSNSTEVHVLGKKSDYKSFLVQTKTCLGATDDSWTFLVASNLDLFAVHRNKSNGKTDLHIISPFNNFSNFSLQIVTGLEAKPNYHKFLLSSNRDLISITREASSTKIHALTVESNYQKLVSLGTIDRVFTSNEWALLLASNNDLFAIKKRVTASESTEVRAYSAESRYKDMIFSTRTSLHMTGSDWGFVLAKNRDLMAIRTKNTQSGMTEVHVLSASSKYKDFTVHAKSGLHLTGTNFEFANSAFEENAAVEAARLEDERLLKEMEVAARIERERQDIEKLEANVQAEELVHPLFSERTTNLTDCEIVATTEAFIFHIRSEMGLVVPDASRIEDAKRILDVFNIPSEGIELTVAISTAILEKVVSEVKTNSYISPATKESLLSAAQKYAKGYGPQEKFLTTPASFFISCGPNDDRLDHEGDVPFTFPTGGPYKFVSMTEETTRRKPNIKDRFGHSVQFLPSKENVEKIRIKRWAKKHPNASKFLFILTNDSCSHYAVNFEFTFSYRVPLITQEARDESTLLMIKIAFQNSNTQEPIVARAIVDEINRVMQESNFASKTSEEIWTAIRPRFESYDQNFDLLLQSAEQCRISANLYSSHLVPLVDTLVSSLEDRKDRLADRVIMPFLRVADLEEWACEVVPRGTYHYGVRELSGFNAQYRNLVKMYHPGIVEASCQDSS